LAEMDLRIEIFVLKLVNAEKFMFGESGGELWRFENLVFPDLYKFHAVISMGKSKYINNMKFLVYTNLSIKISIQRSSLAQRKYHPH
jgi:hypothetical protein